jgi:hypothetical protein
MTTTLQWNGPFSFNRNASDPCIFESDMASRHGVYVHSVRYLDAYLVHYVGKTASSFSVRFHQEIPQLAQGIAWIADAETLGRGIKEWIYIPLKEKTPRPDFQSRRDELMPHVTGVLALTRVFVAPLEETDSVIKEIEKAVMWDVWNHGRERSQRFMCNDEREYGKSRPDLDIRHLCDGHHIWGLTCTAPPEVA